MKVALIAHTALPEKLVAASAKLCYSASSIDTVTEKKIQDAIEHLMKGRTSFVVAHRLSTIKEADVILVMNNGRIVEQGDHAAKQHGVDGDLGNLQIEADIAVHGCRAQHEHGKIADKGSNRRTNRAPRGNPDQIEHDIEHRARHGGIEGHHGLFLGEIRGGKEGIKRGKHGSGNQNGHVQPRLVIGLGKQDHRADLGKRDQERAAHEHDRHVIAEHLGEECGALPFIVRLLDRRQSPRLVEHRHHIGQQRGDLVRCGI